MKIVNGSGHCRRRVLLLSSALKQPDNSLQDPDPLFPLITEAAVYLGDHHS